MQRENSMLLHKKIRFLRLNKGWSQETMADKLSMSPNGYGSIERGETNVQVSRILQIAKLFEIEASELFQELEGKNVFNSTGNNNTEIQNNNNSRCYFGASDGNQQNQTECENERLQLESNVEKQIVMIERQNNEIFLLKQINELLITSKLTPQRVFQRRGDVIYKSEPHTKEQRQTAEAQRMKTNLANC
jgi:transcriptional regulator with XRE-family HTH domain